MSGEAKCRYCEQRHPGRYLCDPARQILVTMHERADSYNMPSIDFDEPMWGPAREALGFGQPGDALLVQVVVKSLVIDTAGVWRPAIVLTGRTADDQVLPQWLYAGEDDDLRRAAALVTERTEAAIAAAAQARNT